MVREIHPVQNKTLVSYYQSNARNARTQLLNIQAKVELKNMKKRGTGLTACALFYFC